MYQEKIIVEDAVPLSPALPESDLAVGETTLGNRLMALLIIAALPFMLIAFVFRFVWSDVKAIGRGVGIAFKVVTEELSRKP